MLIPVACVHATATARQGPLARWLSHHVRGRRKTDYRSRPVAADEWAGHPRRERPGRCGLEPSVRWSEKTEGSALRESFHRAQVGASGHVDEVLATRIDGPLAPASRRQLLAEAEKLRRASQSA